MYKQNIDTIAVAMRGMVVIYYVTLACAVGGRLLEVRNLLVNSHVC